MSDDTNFCSLELLFSSAFRRLVFGSNKKTSFSWHKEVHKSKQKKTLNLHLPEKWKVIRPISLIEINWSAHKHIRQLITKSVTLINNIFIAKSAFIAFFEVAKDYAAKQLEELWLPLKKQQCLKSSDRRWPQATNYLLLSVDNNRDWLQSTAEVDVAIINESRMCVYGTMNRENRLLTWRHLIDVISAAELVLD